MSKKRDFNEDFDDELDLPFDEIEKTSRKMINFVYAKVCKSKKEMTVDEYKKYIELMSLAWSVLTDGVILQEKFHEMFEDNETDIEVEGDGDDDDDDPNPEEDDDDDDSEEDDSDDKKNKDEGDDESSGSWPPSR